MRASFFANVCSFSCAFVGESLSLIMLFKAPLDVSVVFDR